MDVVAHGILDELEKISERGEAVLRTLAGNVVKEKAHMAHDGNSP